MNVALLASAGSPSSLWYLTRASAAMSLLLLSAVIAFGLADVSRRSSQRWPRFAIDALHRYLALLALALIAVHVLTTLLDSYAPISLLAAFIPFASSYRPLWLSFGAIALDLLLALIITSLLRARMKERTWRLVHWLAWACWPIALLHAFGTGSDARNTWFQAIAGACVAVVGSAAIIRGLSFRRRSGRLSAGALATAGAFLLFLGIWLPRGPLAQNWARRAGTPPSLLGHSSSGQLSGSATAGEPQGRAQ